jgi:hypothetical protein
MSEPIPSSMDPALPRQFHRRRTMRLLLLSLIIFICGGAVGWGVGIFLRPPPPVGMGIGPEPPLNAMVRQLREELVLSDDQTKQVHQIYQEREQALRAIRGKIDPELKAEYDKLDAQMKAVLTPAQYQRWNERFQNVRNRMLPPPPPPGGPGRMPGPYGPPPGPRPNFGPPPDGIPPP